MGIYFSDILIKIQQFSLKKRHLFENVVRKMSAILSRPQHVNSLEVKSGTQPFMICIRQNNADNIDCFMEVKFVSDENQ